MSNASAAQARHLMVWINNQKNWPDYKLVKHLKNCHSLIKQRSYRSYHRRLCYSMIWKSVKFDPSHEITGILENMAELNKDLSREKWRIKKRGLADLFAYGQTIFDTIGTRNNRVNRILGPIEIRKEHWIRPKPRSSKPMWMMAIFIRIRENMWGDEDRRWWQSSSFPKRCNFWFSLFCFLICFCYTSCFLLILPEGRQGCILKLKFGTKDSTLSKVSVITVHSEPAFTYLPSFPLRFRFNFSTFTPYLISVCDTISPRE